VFVAVRKVGVFSGVVANELRDAGARVGTFQAASTAPHIFVFARINASAAERYPTSKRNPPTSRI
jgi:hypothetical protein